jgi:hypothetical protein
LARVYLVRALLFLAPFAVYAVWREVARRTGRPMGSTPWPWLIGAGATLAVLSLVAEAVLPHGVDHGRYVPAETRADGTVKPGHFEAR